MRLIAHTQGITSTVYWNAITAYNTSQSWNYKWIYRVHALFTCQGKSHSKMESLRVLIVLAVILSGTAGNDAAPLTY